MTQLRLKDIREKLKKTQEELSEYLSQEKGIRISRSTIAKYESGVIYPSKRTLKKLANALGVSEYYLSGQGYKSEDINENLLQLLHTAFFNYQDEDKTHYAILSYLHNILHETVKPMNYYYDNNGNKLTFSIGIEYPRIDAVDDFWKESFPFLFRDSKFQESLVGTSKLEFVSAVTDRITDIYKRINFSICLSSISKQLEDLDSNVKKISSNILNDDNKNIDIQKQTEFIDNAISQIRNTYYFSTGTDLDHSRLN